MHFKNEEWSLSTSVSDSSRSLQLSFVWLFPFLPPCLMINLVGFKFAFSQSFFLHCAVKEGNPSYYELEGLSQKIVHWRSLGRRLNFHEAQLHGFDNENSQWREKAYAMLRKWKERDGPDATYQVLYEVLCHEYVQRKDLAQKFCCHVEGISLYFDMTHYFLSAFLSAPHLSSFLHTHIQTDWRLEDWLFS